MFATVCPLCVLPRSHILLLPNLLPGIFRHAASAAALEVIPSCLPPPIVHPIPHTPPLPVGSLSPPMCSPSAPLDAEVAIHHQWQWPSYNYLMVSCKKKQKEWQPYVNFLIASPVVISWVPIWKRMFKTEGVSLKYLDMVNVDFIYSELHDK